MRFESEQHKEEAHSIELTFDPSNTWQLGETRICELRFLHWEEFQGEMPSIEFRVFDAKEIAVGSFQFGESEFG